MVHVTCTIHVADAHKGQYAQNNCAIATRNDKTNLKTSDKIKIRSRNKTRMKKKKKKNKRKFRIIFHSNFLTQCTKSERTRQILDNSKDDGQVNCESELSGGKKSFAQISNVTTRTKEWRRADADARAVSFRSMLVSRALLRRKRAGCHFALDSHSHSHNLKEFTNDCANPSRRMRRLRPETPALRSPFPAPLIK